MRGSHTSRHCCRTRELEQVISVFHIYSGDFARAEEAAEASSRERPGNLYTLATRSYISLLLGDLEIAEQRLATAAKPLQDEPLMVSYEGMLHASHHRPDVALERVRRALESPGSFGHTHHTHHNIACIHALLGETEKAMAWLERSVDGGFPCWPFFRIDPHLENLREKPAFTRLVTDLERTYSALKIQRL